MRKMYSKKQIEGMAQSGLVGKDIKVRTIEQSEANQEFTEFTYNEKLSPIDGGYIGIKIINNILYIIITKRFNVNASFTLGSLITINLPNEILVKLKTLPSAFDTDTITSEVGSYQKSGQGVNPLLYKVKKLENGIEIISSTNMQLVEGNAVEISVRTFFELI